MFKRILVPVDGSSTSMQAVDKAIVIAKAFGASVTVVCVIDPYPFTGVGEDFGYGQSEYLSAAMAEAHRSIHDAESAFKAAGLATEARIVENRVPHEGILDTATDLGADMIVMGAYGHMRVIEMVFGGATHHILAHTDIPVLMSH